MISTDRPEYKPVERNQSGNKQCIEDDLLSAISPARNAADNITQPTNKLGVTLNDHLGPKGDTKGLNRAIKESICVGNVHTGCCLTIRESIPSIINYWGSTSGERSTTATKGCSLLCPPGCHAHWVPDSRPFGLPQPLKMERQATGSIASFRRLSACLP